ncbi:MAG TPA: hypothetical protein P5092_11415, partial [Ruminococcus sp.]|nr:hypothetical protein [Ruminococcus sp.]
MPEKPDSAIAKLPQIQPVGSVKVTGMPKKLDGTIAKRQQIQPIASVKVTGMLEKPDSAIAEVPQIQPIGSVKVTGMPKIYLPATRSIDKESVTGVIQRIISIMQGA